MIKLNSKAFTSRADSYPPISESRMRDSEGWIPERKGIDKFMLTSRAYRISEKTIKNYSNLNKIELINNHKPFLVEISCFFSASSFRFLFGFGCWVSDFAFLPPEGEGTGVDISNIFAWSKTLLVFSTSSLPNVAKSSVPTLSVVHLSAMQISHSSHINRHNNNV